MAFYGNITNRRNQFSYDKIYNSFKELSGKIYKTDTENNFTTITIDKDDGIFAGRYVLIKYPDNKTKEEDFQLFGRTFDSTVWQKTYLSNTVQYVLIADFEFDLEDDVFQTLYGDIKPIVWEAAETPTPSGSWNDEAKPEKEGYYFFTFKDGTYELYYVEKDKDNQKMMDPLYIFSSKDGLVGVGKDLAKNILDINYFVSVNPGYNAYSEIIKWKNYNTRLSSMEEG